MASSVSQDPSWADFDTLRHSIKSYTVEKLKHIIVGLYEECGAIISKSGKKQDLIDRITHQLDKYRYTQQTDVWNRARVVLYQVRNTGSYTHSSLSAVSAPSTTAPGHRIPQGAPATSPKAPVHSYHNNIAGPSSAGRYDPLAPRRPVPPSSAPSAPVVSGVNTNIKFKSSPFLKVDQAVSTVVECPESSGAMDRRSQTLYFALNQDQLNKLSQSSPKYQLRLYCTSSTFYSPSPNGFRTMNTHCPIEFPATCEVRVNSVQLSANLKGIKKKPGTAPPADLGKSVRSVIGSQNRVEMVYVNSQQPVQQKKFYLVVLLVEYTNVDQLVERLKKGKYRSADDIKSKLAKTVSEDDDIIAGNQTMSLKCPLSYMRITTPCRSDKCVHSQCFDAMSWYSVMEQTTTWLCPVCEKVLNSEDLIVDGYFDNILRQTPESVEEVIVEPDGEWHTTDEKYGSAGWKAARASKSTVKQTPAARPPVASDPSSQSQLSQPKGTGSTPGASVNGKDAQVNGEIVVLDSDDEDEGRVKRELSPSFAGPRLNGNACSPSHENSGCSGHTISKSKKTSTVIDLTLDSDVDEPPPHKAEKRKADEPSASQEEQSPKRPRAELIPLTTSRRTGNGNGYGNGVSSSRSSPGSIYSPRPHPPLSPPNGSTSNYSPPLPGSSSVHRPGPPPSPYAPRRYPYGPASYNAPHLPSRTPTYDLNDPRRHNYPPPQGYNNNPYLPRINGSGAAGWP